MSGNVCVCGCAWDEFSEYLLESYHQGTLIHIPNDFFFRDEGLVFTITIVQWAVEVSHMIFIIIYMSLQFGKSGIVDRCFANFNAFVGIVLQPFCIFMGDSSFRRRLQEDGLWFALRKELF